MIEKICMDDESFATNPGELDLSMAKLRTFHPSFSGSMKFIQKILKLDKGDEKKIQILREHLYYWQFEPSVVLVIDP